MIYGMGGFNRYVVFVNGEICFHEGFARTSQDIRLARAMGFRICWDFLDTTSAEQDLARMRAALEFMIFFALERVQEIGGRKKWTWWYRKMYWIIDQLSYLSTSREWWRRIPRRPRR